MSRAFTLIEMVVSLAIISIIFLSMGSVMMLSARAVPAADDPSVLAIDANEVIQQIYTELQTAVSLQTVENYGIIFNVPDRDGDGVEETISYLYGTGVLLRGYNGGLGVKVLDGIDQFQLNYKTVAVPQADILVESNEVLLDSFSGALTYGEFPITQFNWAGQLIDPGNLPAEAVGWSVTRVLIQAKRHSSDTGVTRAQLRPATNLGMPTDTVLETQLIYENTLDSNFRWETINFSEVQGVAPNDELCLVLAWQAGSEALGVRHSTLLGSNFLTSYTKGGNWASNSLQSMYFYAYGTYTTPEPQPPINSLKSVTLILNMTGDPADQTRTIITTLNQPEMP